MVAEDAYMIVFRLIHVLAGVLWVGGVFMVVAFLQPGAARLGPAAGPFLQEMMARRQLPRFLVSMGGLTVLSGLFLYARDWWVAGSLGDWVGSTFGAVLTVGAVAALIALLIGGLGARPTIERTLALGRELAAAEGPPPAERAAELQALQARGRALTRAALGFLLVAVVAMATARSW
jgi:uncharacterized membrane protein